MAKILRADNLECTINGHQKEYRMTLEENDGVFSVEVLWGAIGSALKPVTKHSGDDEAKARKEYDKILTKQLTRTDGSRYSIVGGKDDGQNSTSNLVTTAVAKKEVIARVPPMLCGDLTPLGEAGLEQYITDDRYVFEEKVNGTRKEVMKGEAEDLAITNKQGQPTGKGMLPKTQEQFKSVTGSFTVDTEDEPVGGGCILLDILTLNGKPLDRKQRFERRPILEDFYANAGFNPKIVRVVEQAVGEQAKRAFLAKMRRLKAEGIIVKDNQSVYVGGEAGREYQWKFKFQHTASFIVHETMLGGKRNMSLAVLDGLRRVFCGKCTVPTNKKMPVPGDVVEVRFDYVEHGTNALSKAFYERWRDDVNPSECKIEQIKPYYKQRASDRED